VHNYYYLNQIRNLEYKFQSLLSTEQSNSNVQESAITNMLSKCGKEYPGQRRLNVFTEMEEGDSEKEELNSSKDEQKFENEYFSDKETQNSSSSSDASRRESLISHRSSNSFKSSGSSYDNSPSVSYMHSYG
jgi:hypothetical protein